MRSAHNLKSSSNSFSSLSSHIEASFSVKSSSAAASPSTPSYLDLHFSSTNPYEVVSDPGTKQSRKSRKQSPVREQDGDTLQLNDFPSPNSLYPTLAPSAKTFKGNPHPLSLTHEIAERKRAAAAQKEKELRLKEEQQAIEARRELRNTVR